MNDRGQSIGIAQFILALVVGSICLYLITEVADAVLPGAKDATTNETANQATEWMQTVPEILPIVILVLAFIGLIVLAVFRRELS